MRKVIQMSAISLALISQVVPACAGDNKTQRMFSRDHTEIESPSFSRNGTEMVFTIKAHEPDGAEGESYSEKQLDEIAKRKDTNPRWADPQVSILKLANKSLETVGYGWTGAFSSDATKVYFDYQVKPITGLRRLAETQQGNDIRVFDRASKKTATLVTKPESGYLSDPKISPDGKKLAYSFNDVTNGAYGGSVGWGILDLTKNATRIAVAPKKVHGLYKLPGSATWVGSAFVAAVSVPTSGGTFMADHYETDVVNDAGKVLFHLNSPAEETFNDVECAATKDGLLEVFNGATQKSTIVNPQTGKTVLSRKSVAPSTLSPDRRFALEKGNQKFAIKNVQTGKKRTIAFKGELREFVWSPDSKQLAFVTSINDGPTEVSPFLRDELWVLQP